MYGPCSQKSALFFQRPGTRISWSHGVFGKRKTPLKNSSQRGAFQIFLFLVRMFVASLLSINHQSSIRFAWWVHISGVTYYDGKRQVSEFARFKRFLIKKIIEIDRDIGKKPSLTCHLISFRYGDYTSGFQLERAGNDCSRLCSASTFYFFFSILSTWR